MKPPWLLLKSAARSSREYDTPNRTRISLASLHGVALSPDDRRLVRSVRCRASHSQVDVIGDRGARRCGVLSL